MDDSLRVFGTELSGNRRGRQPLTPEARASICALAIAGKSTAILAQAFNCTPQTIRNTLKRRTERPIFTDKPRSGRPKLLNEREERCLVRLSRRFPKLPYHKLLSLHNQGGVRISHNTLRRVVKRHNLKKWLSKNRPRLTRELAILRREFCARWYGREEELASVG